MPKKKDKLQLALQELDRALDAVAVAREEPKGPTKEQMLVCTEQLWTFGYALLAVAYEKAVTTSTVRNFARHLFNCSAAQGQLVRCMVAKTAMERREHLLEAELILRDVYIELPKIRL
jgi:hypothetical protein